MGESNGDWGALENSEMQEAWDSYAPIPEPGESVALDSFVAAKNITHGSLVRLGARLSTPTVLAFPFPGAVKFRNILNGARFNWTGATFNQLKIVKGADRESIILAEGETDAARLSDLYPCDVGIMPVGARTWKDSFTPQVSKYRRILVGLDNDEAGEVGFQTIHVACPTAIRFAPPTGTKDWCALEGTAPPLPEMPPPQLGLLVPARDLLALQVPDLASWFSDAVLPVGGTAVIHGTFKSFKTWIALAMASSLAQMEPWCKFEPVEEPARVAYLNFEIPWAYYRERVATFANSAARPDLFGENFLTYSPLTRPRLVAGVEASEMEVVTALVDAGVQVVFIDPVRRAMGYADMNAENEVRRILQFAERLTREGMSVVYCHHDNKESDRHGGGDPSGMTGSGAWGGDADTIISIERPAGAARDDTRRNLKFLLRNAPSPSPRGFRLLEDSTIHWTDEPWTDLAAANDPLEKEI